MTITDYWKEKHMLTTAWKASTRRPWGKDLISRSLPLLSSSLERTSDLWYHETFLQWPHMANNVYKTVIKGLKFAQAAWILIAKDWYNFSLHGDLWSNSPLTCLDCYPGQSVATQYIIKITDGYLTLNHAMPTCQTVPMHIATIFFDYWVILYFIDLFSDRELTQILSPTSPNRCPCSVLSRS